MAYFPGNVGGRAPWRIPPSRVWTLNARYTTGARPASRSTTTPYQASADRPFMSADTGIQSRWTGADPADCIAAVYVPLAEEPTHA
jgi:hypothetical protein